MKTCRPDPTSHPEKLWRQLLFFLLVSCVIQESRIMVVCGKCIHDTLKPSRGTSPQRYILNFVSSSQSSSTRPFSTTPQPTSVTRQTRVGYYYRYRYLRYKTTPRSKTTPSVSRPKRYVEEDSNSTVADGNSTGTNYNKDETSVTGGSTNQTQSRSTLKEENDENKGEKRGVYEIYSNKYGNQTQWSSSNSSSSETVDFNEFFHPIRITLFFDDDHIEYVNTSTEYKRLNESLQHAVRKLTKILSVVPVQGPLLFKRSDEKICSGFWSSPSQTNSRIEKRCGIARTSYNGEECLDGFKIPDDHLQGYLIYGDRNNENRTTILYEKGSGIPDTDTVIYIHAERTTTCKDKGIIAYATYCQLDQNSRPIAGFANFCPDHLGDILYDSDTLYLTALHEFFHALGFSKDLFDKFQDCFAEKVRRNVEGGDRNSTEMQWVCENRGKTVSFIDNRKHIVTPAVTRETQNHLNCSSKQGCPLENHVLLPLKTSSHWEARFMQGSLMSPTIGRPHLTFIDRITLGAFEDMGWYQVDYLQAEDLVWGRYAGCDFESLASCVSHSSPYFCNQKDVRNGCNYLHLDKGTCETDLYLEGCRVYKTHGGMECWKPNNLIPELTALKGEIYSLNSRCFMSNLLSSNARFRTRFRNQYEGRCYMHRCNGSNVLEVQVEGSGWKACPEGDSIQFDGYEGSLNCPPASLLCAYDFGIDTTTAVIGPTEESRKGDSYCAKIRISFPKLGELRAQMRNNEEPELAEEAERKLDMFLMKFTNEIVAVTDIDETRIVEIQYVDDHAVQFVLMKYIDWTTYTPKDPESSLNPGNYVESEDPNSDSKVAIRYQYVEVPCTEAVRRLLMSVRDGDFKVPVDGETYKADQINFTSPDAEMDELNSLTRPPQKPSHTGSTAAVAVGVICGTMLLGVGALLIWKSHVTTAVSPAPQSPTSTDVRYHPNHALTAPPSESGSMGQLTFMA